MHVYEVVSRLHVHRVWCPTHRQRGKSKEYIHKYMLATRTLLRELTMELQS